MRRHIRTESWVTETSRMYSTFEQYGVGARVLFQGRSWGERKYKAVLLSSQCGSLLVSTLYTDSLLAYDQEYEQWRLH